MKSISSRIRFATTSAVTAGIWVISTATIPIPSGIDLLTPGLFSGIAQPVIPVRVDRWLQIQQITGQVKFFQESGSRDAKVGDRLQYSGDGVSTGKRSGVTLLVDTGVGEIDVAESTSLRIQSLEIAPDDGRITRLAINQGQAKLRLRRFTNRGSRLEIRTPASLSAVRGTTFGVAIQPSGKTGLAVNAGGVSSEAAGRSVAVDGGFQNFTIPGEPPSDPVPLRDDTSLRYEFKRVIQRGVRKVQLMGQVDPVNSVLIGGKPQDTDRGGHFNTDLQALPNSLSFEVLVITPLGKQQQYNLNFN
jgi:FecR protein